MKYLYGDASESPLEFDYITFFNDVLDFSVALLSAEDMANEQARQAKQHQEHASAEIEQLGVIGQRLAGALDERSGLQSMPVTDRCLSALRDVVASEVQRSESAVNATLEEELGGLQASAAECGRENFQHLETLLLQHELPESSQVVNVRLSKSGRYRAELSGSATGIELSWEMNLDIPGDHIFKEPLRVRALMPELSIKVSEEGGWVRKSVQVRTHNLVKYYVVAVRHASDATTVKLRTSAQDQDTGYDLHYNELGEPLSVVSVAKGAEEESFAIRHLDVADLRKLREELDAALSSLSKCGARLRSAELDETSIQEHPHPGVLVARLVAQIAPVVREIAKHSQSPNELVVKRVLSDNRREEIFALKSDLRRKLDPLSPEARARLDPLGLGDAEADEAKSDEAPRLPTIAEALRNPKSRG